MCGIAGVYRRSGVGQEELDTCRLMSERIKHRGPDDSDIVQFERSILAHRRLSIIDLSSDGHQPFFSEDKRLCLIFNGEIYNYLELKEELTKLGRQFRTKTDTEVLLQAFEEFGPECLGKLNGMFAFAIYNIEKKELFLARDRFGMKPLYWSKVKGAYYFASEIKALLEVSEISRLLDHQAAYDYLALARTDIGADTLFQSVKRIEKGHFAVINGDQLNTVRWWSPRKYIESKAGSYQEALKEIRSLFLSSLQMHMRSDVAVGSCLSGGLDSTIILGGLAELNLLPKDYSTFTAAFPGSELDETSYIDELKGKIQFENYRTYPNWEDCLSGLEIFVRSQDEPSIQPSAYSQFQVMQLAAERNVTVLLDGQGADELFGGYQYMHAYRFRELSKFTSLNSLGTELFHCLKENQHRLGYWLWLYGYLPEKFQIRLVETTNPFLKRDFIGPHFKQSEVHRKLLSAGTLTDGLIEHFEVKLEHLLRMEDRNSMHFSLETRLPYLDSRLVEYCLGLTGDWKISAGQTKRIQKDALGDFTTGTILNRRDKIGFGTPARLWKDSLSGEQLLKDSLLELSQDFPKIFQDVKSSKLDTNAWWRIIQFCKWKNVFNVC
jgi:asparagine synthase (glutamine-hydrolysing)